jgi:predicted transcriptional regulator
MKRSFTALGETEMELLQHVWEMKHATVAEVHQRVLQTRPVAYTTIMSILKKLADKGLLGYEQEGSAYVYFALKPAEQVRANVLRDVLNKVFSGSPMALVQTLVAQEHFDETQLAEIRQLIEAMGDAQEESNMS